MGATERYGVREQAPQLSLTRIDLRAGDPRVTLPASAEQIRTNSAQRARGRSFAALGVIIGVTVLIAAAAILAIVVIASL
ncbi:hypothetical protein GCM10027056_11130 [Glaciibacter psychrotolerans]